MIDTPIAKWLAGYQAWEKHLGFDHIFDDMPPIDNRVANLLLYGTANPLSLAPPPKDHPTPS